MCKRLICLVSLVSLLGLVTDVVRGQEVIKINFQRTSDVIPEGYLPDYGLMFGNRGNGYSYGWNTDITRLAHKRNSSPDPRYDTNVDMQDPTTNTDYTWEIELPSGIYNVFLVCGDAYYDNHVSNIDVEGTILADLDGRSNFDQYSLGVIVTDGRLTIKPALGAFKTSCVFVHIGRIETFKAYGPDPKDGSIFGDTFAILGWTPGDGAISHNVYLGDNFDNVNNGTGDTFKGNQTDASYTDSLVPDTTYYWRIDEVNAAHPESPCRGDIWSFKTAPQTAYNPIPADGATMVELNVTLSWTGGIGAKLHNVYLGLDKNAVESATTTSPECMVKQHKTTSYQPVPTKITIEKSKTYYWRIDEFDGSVWHQGDIWSFTTIPVIAISDPNLLLWWKFDKDLDTATIAFDSSGYDHHGAIHGTNLVTNGRVCEARDFFGRTSDYVADDDAEEYLNGLSAITVCMWIKSSVIGVDSVFIHTIYPYPNDDAVTIRYDKDGAYGKAKNVFKMGVRTYYSTEIDYKQRYESAGYVQSTEWQHVAMTWSTGELVRFYINSKEDSPTWFELPGPSGSTIARCNTFEVGTGGYGSWNGLIDDVRVYNKALVKDEISRVMIGEPDYAWNPSPSNGSKPDLHRALPLSWSPGSMAAQHDVYFGTDGNAVADANTSATGIYRSRQVATSYTPTEGVEWGKGPYYWRIDEYNTDGTITKGRLWEFTVADFILVDDIEDYNDSPPNRVFETWKDGYGYTIYQNGSEIGTNCGNGTRSTIGHAQTPFAEIAIFNSGGQSMPLYFDNSSEPKFNICSQPLKLYYSEARRTLDYPRDWTEQGVKALTLWFRGYAAGFKEGPAGIYTMTASGQDIWDEADDFRFVYKRFTGAGSIVAKVLNIQFGNDQSKAGVMIRRTLDPTSPYAAVLIRAGGECRFDYRPSPGDNARSAGTAPNIFTPCWVKLERDSSDNFNGYYSSDGVSWQAIALNPQYVAMTGEIYIGLALTLKSLNAKALCKAQFSDVMITGSVSPPVSIWNDEVIGSTVMPANDPELLYVAVADSAGSPAVIYHDDPNAAQIDTWTEWNINLKDFADRGINLSDVDSIAIGLGNRNNPQIGGSGIMFIDDIRLYRSRCVPDKLTLSKADINSDCVVDFKDLETMADDWLTNVPGTDLNSDSKVDFKDYAVLAEQWLEQKLWP